MLIGLGYQPSTREEAEDALLYWKLKKKVLEVRICETDPNDEETDGGFGDIVTDILDARDEIERFRGLIAKFRAENYLEATNGAEKYKA